MIATCTNHVSRGVQNFNDTSKKFTWFKTNFNMPVPNYMTPNSPFTRYQGCWNYLTETSSYNLSGFSPGYEICVGHGIYDFENNGASNFNVNTLLSGRWTDPSLNTLFWGWEDVRFTYTLAPTFYVETWFGANIGCAPWEINSNGTYHFRAGAQGTPTITSVDTAVTMSNVPSISTLSSDKIGYIWVEGNNLCYVNANQWKHTMVGTNVSSSPGSSNAGKIWIDTSNFLHWVGSDGHDYRATWTKRQFASFYNNGATSTVNAGTSKRGCLWVDSEYGDTHLGFIGYDGFKYVTGAGNDPYA